jgi:hypothetical protein
MLSVNCRCIIARLRSARSHIVQYLLDIAAGSDPARWRFLYRDTGQGFRDVADAVRAP